jgi:DNA-binding response OmpR family regulator
VQAESPSEASGLLTALNGDIALVVVNVDAHDGPDIGLIKRVRGLGLPVLAFGLEGSTAPLARALDAGADDVISLGEPVNHFIGKAAQLAS